MNSTWSDVMIMPDSQQSQHARRERAMHRQVRPDDTMPILHSSTGSHGMFPLVQQGLGLFAPGRIQACHQVLDAWTQHRTALPCPGKQAHRLWSQSLVCLLLGCIKICGKQHQMRKCQTQLLAQRPHILLQGRQGLFCQLLQQGQQGLQFLLTICAPHDPGWPKHNDLQQTPQFLRQIAESLSNVAGLSDALLMGSGVRLRHSSPCFFPLGDALSLSLNNWQAVLQVLHRSITAPLHLGCCMQHMPDIPLMALQSLHLAKRFLNSSSSITDTALTAESLLTQIPPDQRPTFPVYRYRRHGGPHLSAVNINHIEISFSSLTAVLLIQGQGTRGAGLLLAQPALGTLPGFLHDPHNASHAHLDATHLQQTGLDIAITGMRFDQQGQHPFLHLHPPFGRVLPEFQSGLQGLSSFLFPSIQRLTRDLMATTQLAHQPMGWFGNQQLTDPLNSLFGCARMVHVSSLRAVSLFLLSPYLSGMLLATFPPIVTLVPALFEPCLTGLTVFYLIKLYYYGHTD